MEVEAARLSAVVASATNDDDAARTLAAAIGLALKALQEGVASKMQTSGGSQPAAAAAAAGETDPNGEALRRGTLRMLSEHNYFR